MLDTRSQIFVRDPAGMSDEDVEARVRVPLWCFNTLQIIGFALNLIIVLTVALNHKRVRRTVVWYLFMSSWVVWCIAYGFLFLFGYQGPRLPPPGLCLFQAALLYALPPFGASLTFGILAQLYCAMHVSLHQRRPHKYINLSITVIPFILFSAVFIGVIVAGIGHMDIVSRDPTHMYCHLMSETPAKISALLVGLTSFAMLILESLVLVTLFRHWKTFMRIQEVPGNILSGTMAFRITVFSFMPMIALILSVASVLSTDFSTSAISNVAVAFLPVIAALIFGTQRDVLSSLVLRKGDKYENEVHISAVGVPPVVHKEVFVSEV